MKGDFLWAVAQMMEDKKVRRSSWKNKDYYWDIEFIKNKFEGIDSRSSSPEEFMPAFQATDWKIVEDKVLPDDITICHACGCMTKCICGKCKAIKRTSKEA